MLQFLCSFDLKIHLRYYKMKLFKFLAPKTIDCHRNYCNSRAGQVSSIPLRLNSTTRSFLVEPYSVRTTGIGIHVHWLGVAALPCMFLFMALNLTFNLHITLVVKNSFHGF